MKLIILILDLLRLRITIRLAKYNHWNMLENFKWLSKKET